MTPAISICIPTYEMKSQGKAFLEIAFKSIYAQLFTDFEVVVSDHSDDDEIQQLCQVWESAFPLRYIRYTENKGKSSANLNNAIQNATGDYIKPLFQDDLFYSTTSLLTFFRAAQANPKTWIASGCWHIDEHNTTQFNYHKPKWNTKMTEGINTIGAPSVILFRNGNIRFDNELIWLMDCEFYERLTHTTEKPVCIAEPLVLIRQWANSVTNAIATDLIKKKELDYVRQKVKKKIWTYWH